MPVTECQKFFALSKRVPKDVKRYCGICRQHGVLEETRGHTCTFKDCTCNKCQLVRTRRQIMSQQIRLRRAQDKRFQRTNEPNKADVVPIKLVNDEFASIIASSQNAHSMGLSTTTADELLSDAKNMCYFCQKCKNHEILVWKKQHKRQCPFTECTCEKCELIETRRRLDQHMKKKKASLKAAIAQEAANSMHSPHLSPSPKESGAHSPDSFIDFTRHQSPAHSTHSSSTTDSAIKIESTIKIEDAFLQQKPMFIPSSAPMEFMQSPPQLQQFSPQTLFVSPQPQLSLSQQFVPAPTFVTSAPFLFTQSDMLAVAIAQMNAGRQPTSPDMYQMVKTVTPPVQTSPINQVDMMPQPMSFKEMEQLLMLKYRMQQKIQ